MGATSADEIARAELSIDNITAVLVMDLLRVMPDQIFTHALHEPCVELNPANGVLVRSQGESQLSDLHLELSEACEIAGIGCRVQVNIAHHPRSYPAGAGLWARKLLFVQ